MSAMNDKELLKLAAKASGCPPEWGGEIWVEMDNGPRLWSPLTHDGDALRLAVKMRFELNVEEYGASVREYKTRVWTAFEAHLHGGIEAATRRAIVVAAAEIGKAMP